MTKKNLTIILSFFITILSSFANRGSNELFIHNGASNFDEVTIGNQVWTAKNLDVSNFRNGDPIREAKTNEEWEWCRINKQPAWCYYNNDPRNGVKYGKLYNWYAVSDPRGLAPKGFHIPSDEEWGILMNYLGGEEVAGEKMKLSDFSGLPGGYRGNISRYYDDGRIAMSDNGSFKDIGDNGYWWSSSEVPPDYPRKMVGRVWIRYLLYYGTVHTKVEDKFVGLSVRCIRDKRDSNESTHNGASNFDDVTIGNQVFTAKNLPETIHRNVQDKPEFPGGEDAMLRYIQKSIRYPNYAVENEIEGTVQVEFIINEVGSIENIKVLKGIKGGCDEEAIRIVRSMPKWKPGRQNGKFVKTILSVPVVFRLD